MAKRPRVRASDARGDPDCALKMQTVVCICHDRVMDNTEQVSIAITLSPTQVDEVVRAASRSRAPSIATLIADTLSEPRAPEDMPRPFPTEASATAGGTSERSHPMGYLAVDSANPKLSRSLLRGLSLLTCFGPDGGARGIVELAHDAGMSPSTAHRYVSTLVELGLLERCPKSRKYRLPGSVSKRLTGA